MECIVRYKRCWSFLLAFTLCSFALSGCAGPPPEPIGKDMVMARQELARMRSWLNDPGVGKLPPGSLPELRNVMQRLRAASMLPKSEAIAPLRREVLTLLGKLHGGDGSFALGLTHGLDKVLPDEPFSGGFGASIRIGLAKNESEGGQLVVISTGKELRNVSVRLDGRLAGTARSNAFIPASQVNIELVGYVDTTIGSRPYKSPKPGWWPDPLLANRPFDVKRDEIQPLLVTVTTTHQTEQGEYAGKLVVSVDGVDIASIPLSVRVFGFELPSRGHFATFALGCGPDKVADFYGGDPDGKIMERFAVESFRHRMPPAELLNGWGWSTAKTPKRQDGSYDFAVLDRWLDLFKAGGVTRFPMVVVPRFRRFGGGDYTEGFKRELGNFIKAYAKHLKAKGLFDAAVMYNIDEASNDPEMREWEVCKELYRVSKQAAPDLPVLQCLNEYKGIKALAGYADIWDLYFGQYEKSGGAARLAAGDQIMLSVCIWPSGHPNLFIEYPLLDARVMPWIAFREGAKGFEYWEMFTSWKNNRRNRDWWKGSTRTSWKLAKPHGDGLLLYPGPDGAPFPSLRLEALRDGIEDYEYLVLLSGKAKNDAEAKALLKEAKRLLVTGATSYDRDPHKLLDLRNRIGLFLEKK
ncbi:MAG: DUF4091 domain-containing protein [Geobacteraceae bacterium]|nr:DUF4091 domain-containing protein [Geobacteraceae bacterium]